LPAYERFLIDSVCIEVGFVDQCPLSALRLLDVGTSPGMGRGAVAGFAASVVLNRKDFGIDINMPMETGGVVLGDKVAVTLDIEARKSA
jgi:hypothetical protein